MATFIGAVLDFSGSMHSNVDEEGGPWARSVFKVIDDLIKHDVTDNNIIFAVGTGARVKNHVFDTIVTLEQLQKERNKHTECKGQARNETIEKIFDILERNGANTIRKWAETGVVTSAVTEAQARLILDELESDHDRVFTTEFVALLPDECKDWGEGFKMVQGAYAWGVSKLRKATRYDIRKVVNMAMVKRAELMVERVELKAVSAEAVVSSPYAAEIVRGCVGDKQLTNRRARELHEQVKPFIYGRTPLFEALQEAVRLFSRSRSTHPNHRRVLFVLSDGKPTDEGNLETIKTELEKANVTVVGCYIQHSTNVQPRRLYNVADARWEDGAHFLYTLSSTVPTELVTREIFVKQGWQIDITNNETRLFVHVNHPDHIRDVCKLARNAVCCQDALSDLLVDVDLDIYISQKNASVSAHQQVGDTCYANAYATVLHLAMHRILGRNRPEFNQLRDEMIERWGIEGASTGRVLRKFCPCYKLRCNSVDVNGAMQAIAAKRPVVARFELTLAEWKEFRGFYARNPGGILKQGDLNIGNRPSGVERSGHAVVLTSFNSECLYLMNSWGDKWADKGFFRVANAEVLNMSFFDVYWELSDLTQEEKDDYHTHGSTVAKKLMSSLKGLQVATFPCPLCGQISNVIDFNGNLSRATCPKCSRDFSCNEVDGNILALNIHLTSIAQSEKP